MQTGYWFFNTPLLKAYKLLLYFRAMISLVRLTPNDASLLSEMGGVSLIESHGHSAPAKVMQEYVDKSFSTEACAAELSNEANIFFAVYYNTQPAGYSKIVFNCSHPDVPMQPVTKLERLYLLKEFYGLHLGNHLLQQAVDLSKANGEKGIWLNVWKKNERAIRFYEKQEFKTVGESQFVLTATHANPNWVMLLVY
jgi:ribosomal protein S18 acetylase RimI-like enzyme